MTKFLSHRWTRAAVFLLCLLPLADLAWRWQHNQLGFNRLETVARFTGNWTLRFLLASLAITPLRRIPALNSLIRYRRMLGLYAFFYGLLHALHYFGIDAQWNWQIIGEDLTIRRFFIAGMLSLSLMLPLALTSTNWAIRKMGGKRWQLLHRLAYLSAIAGVVHYFWQGKAALLPPMLYGALLALLLGFRLFQFYANRMHRR